METEPVDRLMVMGAAMESHLANGSRVSRRYRAAFVVWCCLVMSVAWVTPAGASFAKETAVDSIEQSYRIPITNPEDGTTMPSLLVVASATLDTTSPIHSQLHRSEGNDLLDLAHELGSDSAQLRRSALGRLLLRTEADARIGPSLRRGFGPKLHGHEI